MKCMLLSLVVSLAPAFAMAQIQPSVNIDLGAATDTYEVGARVPVPVMMLVRNQAQVKELSLEIAYPARLIDFREVVPGGAAQGSQAEIRTEEGEVSEERKTLLLELVAETPIPEGVLAELVFEVVGELTFDEEVRLENVNQSARSPEGVEIEAQGIDGVVTSMEFIPACLFYMH